MPIISPRDVDEYIEKRHKQHFLFLVFGANSGLVAERSRILLERRPRHGHSTERILTLSGDAIASDPNVLLNELHSPGLFDEAPPAVRIVLGSRTIIPALDVITGNPPFDARIVIESATLKRSSPLIKWFEGQAHGAAIECYPDQPRDLQRLIDAELRATGISIDADARELLLSVLGDDRMLSRSELEKLLLYTLGQHSIRVRDTTELFMNASHVSANALAMMEAFSGNSDATINLINHMTNSASEFGSIALNSLRYALALHHARTVLNGGGAFDSVAQELIRTIAAFSRKQDVASHLRTIPAPHAANLIAAFYDLIKATRKSHRLADDRITGELIKLAKTSLRSK